VRDCARAIYTTTTQMRAGIAAAKRLRSTTADRLEDRKTEHTRKHPPGAGRHYEMTTLESGIPKGKDLDKAEEDWIRAGGGPSRPPNGVVGGLSNWRHQLSDTNYTNQAKASGTPTMPWPQ